MKATEFCYWLQGWFELEGTDKPALTPKQVEVIKNHLNMVFLHDIDPKYPNKVGLDKLHKGGFISASPDLSTTMRC